MKTLYYLSSLAVLLTWTALAQFGQTVQYFPQFAVGDLAESHFSVHNPGDQPVSVSLQLFLSDGSLFDERQVQVPPDGTVTEVFSDPDGELTNGWARLSSTRAFTSSLFYRIGGVGNVGVAPSAEAIRLKVFNFEEGGIRTGFAVANPSETQPSEITYRGIGVDGNVFVSGGFRLDPGEHRAFFFNEAPTFAGSDGSIDMEASSPVIAVALRVQDSLLAGVPVVLPHLIRVEFNEDSPNVIGGHEGNFAAQGVAGGTISGGGVDGTVAPPNFGEFNCANCVNRVTDPYGTVGGGIDNQAAFLGTVGGGSSNAAGPEATVGGGTSNNAASLDATIGGGQFNQAIAFAATVAGGSDHLATGQFSAVGGGLFNTADGNNATVSGGDLNTAAGDNATVGGGRENYAGPAEGQGGSAGVEGKGNPLFFDGFAATVAGGQGNTVNGEYGTVGGGIGNTAGPYATVAGGQSNNATFGEVGGGVNNSALDGTVAGGYLNAADGVFSMIPGGQGNTALGFASFAAGNFAAALADGSFVWADKSSDEMFGTFFENSFWVRAAGGVRIYSNSSVTSGVRLEPGSSSWSMISDRANKENLEEVQGRKVLERLAALPISTWNYKSQPAEVRHMGPMAQDFRAAFGLGESERRISNVDADGVALAAIQGLYRLLQEKDAELESLRAELAEIRAMIAHR